MSTQADSATLFYRTLKRLLRPLVKGLIGHGIIFPAFIELMRELYVDVAKRDFRVEGKEQTLSRISLMTGVTRREIRRILDKVEDDDRPPVNLSLGARVITIWLGHKDYLDSQNRPLPLPLTARNDGPSLESLVASVSKDVRARALLDEWLRLGIVEMSGYIVKLKKTAFIPEEEYETKLYYFGRNLADHVAAGIHNLESDMPFFDRSVYYDQLSLDSLEELREFIHAQGPSLLLSVNRKARELADQDATSGKNLRGRMTLGVYYFSEEEES